MKKVSVHRCFLLSMPLFWLPVSGDSVMPLPTFSQLWSLLTGTHRFEAEKARSAREAEAARVADEARRAQEANGERAEKGEQSPK
jgi:hypothetical protein